MVADRVMFKGGSIRNLVEVRGCEPDIMQMFSWPWPWPFEVSAGGQVIAVCRDHEAANNAARDWMRSRQDEQPELPGVAS